MSGYLLSWGPRKSFQLPLVTAHAMYKKPCLLTRKPCLSLQDGNLLCDPNHSPPHHGGSLLSHSPPWRKPSLLLLGIMKTTPRKPSLYRDRISYLPTYIYRAMPPARWKGSHVSRQALRSIPVFVVFLLFVETTSIWLRTLILMGL